MAIGIAEKDYFAALNAGPANAAKTATCELTLKGNIASLVGIVLHLAIPSRVPVLYVRMHRRQVLSMHTFRGIGTE